MSLERVARLAGLVIAAGALATPALLAPADGAPSHASASAVAPAPPAAGTLRRSVVVGGSRRLVVTARDTKPAARCASNGDRRAVRASIALERIRGRRAERGFAVTQVSVLVDGVVQSRLTGRKVPALLRGGTLHWQSRTSAGQPFMVAGRHDGSIELVTTAGRTRVSVPFYVCM